MNALRITRPEDIHLEQLAFRYPTRSALTLEAEIRQVAACVERGYPRLSLQRLRSDTLSIVGFGPTLADTWRQITLPCLTMSGSHDFLLDRGIVPTWHAQCDGRDHQVKFLSRPQPATTYLMASICPPAIWDQLSGQTIQYWHNCHGQHVVDWIGQHDDGALLVAGGTTIGLNAIHLGGILGFRKFRLFGMDGHSVKGNRHAGRHHDPVPQRVITRRANSRSWTTSPQMSNACDELLRLLETPGIDVEVVGESLQADLVADWRRASAWWSRIFEAVTAEAVASIRARAAECEPRRQAAKYNTGTIPEPAAVALSAISQQLRPRVAVEIGTFIGTSTLAIQAEHVYTCDRDNDCLQSTDRITCHPYTTSTAMLGPLVDRGVTVDLFFFDGRIAHPDVPLILRLSTPQTIYVFDDYFGADKGVANVSLLQPFLSGHSLVTPVWPVRDTMTLAALVPGGVA